MKAIQYNSVHIECARKIKHIQKLTERAGDAERWDRWEKLRKARDREESMLGYLLGNDILRDMGEL